MAERSTATATRTQLAPAAIGAVDQALAMLERVLQSELADHHVLLGDLDRKREAIRLADLRQINDITRREETILARMRDREKARQQLGQRVAAAAGLGAPAKLSTFITLAHDEQAARLHALRSELEAAAREIRSRSTIVRMAAEALSTHMAGVLQTVTGALSRAGVYGRRGTLQLGQAGASNVDLRS